MMPTIAGWLAGKVSGLIIFCLACLGAILIPVTIYQTVQIYGAGFPLPIIGQVTLVEGLKPTIVSLKETIEKAQDRLIEQATEYNRRTILLKEQGDLAVEDQRKKTIDAEADLKAQQVLNKQTNAHLMEILNHAKASDQRAVGPAVQLYLDGLRSKQGQTTPSH